MALFAKDEKTATQTPVAQGSGPAADPAPRAPATAEVQAHLGEGSQIDGKLSFAGSVRIDGEVQGEIRAKGTVFLGEKAVISAAVEADAIVVQGRVTGDLTARSRIELRAPAKVLGNLHTPSLVIHEGVLFEGQCRMGAGDARAERSDNKVAIFPKEDRSRAAAPSEAASH